MRIALTSTDGKAVNQHFGHARTFHIFDLNDRDWAFVETREVEACCQDHDHTTDRFDAVLKTLSDCEAILASKIGYGAAQYLMQHGMKVCQAAGAIPDVLEEVIQEHVLDD
jgi:predicted Fe-Mo cluster-binding NifX family protein